MTGISGLWSHDTLRSSDQALSLWMLSTDCLQRRSNFMSRHELDSFAQEDCVLPESGQEGLKASRSREI